MKWGTETSKPTTIVYVKCYNGCMQDKRTVGRGDDAGKCEHITEEEKPELNQKESDGVQLSIKYGKSKMFSRGREEHSRKRSQLCTNTGTIGGGAVMAEFGRMCVVQCIIGGETAGVDSATRLEKNDPERAEFRNTNLLAAP